MDTQKRGKVFFTFIEVTNNTRMWLDFANKQKSLPNYEIIGGGVNGFIQSLKNRNAYKFIAYMSNEDHTKESTITVNNFKDIEMLVTVCTTENCPFVMHMGIFRPSTYEGVKHPNMSMILHGFAASRILAETFATHKKYMITAPLESMRKIFSCHDVGQQLCNVEIDCSLDNEGDYNIYNFKSLKILEKNGENQDTVIECEGSEIAWFVNHPYTLSLTNPDKNPLFICHLGALSQHFAISPIPEDNRLQSLDQVANDLSEMGLGCSEDDTVIDYH